MRKSFSILSWVLVITIAAILGGCAAKGDNPGREYAPNMYHSVAYEPLSQITDPSAGAWVETLENREGEYYNSNGYNERVMNSKMNMRYPAPNTVKRNPEGWLPYRGKTVPKDSIPLVTKGLVSPYDSASTPAVIADGKLLYTMYCKHCHGEKGEGDGKVADKYPGVANLRGPAYLGISEGHIFHVIANGAGLMQPHGSQVSPADRWKIARYIKTTLQK